ncbi:MAG: lysylphosphatidylglycerol synthase domain-containing protein [Saprospiraceae bacterium]
MTVTTRKRMMAGMVALWQKRAVRVWVRRAVGVLLLLGMVWQVWRQQDLPQWWVRFVEALHQPGHVGMLVVGVLLMPLNWWLEAAKWRVLMWHRYRPSWGDTVQAVLAGISVSLLTPNRVGEYGGRALVVPAEQLVTVVATSVLGSLCQWVVFVGLGWPALMHRLGQWGQWGGFFTGLAMVSVPLMLVVVLLFGRHFLDMAMRWRWLNGKRWWRWLRIKALVLTRLRRRQLWVALALAGGRYGVYALQYLLFLWFFNASMELWEGLSGIFAIYLIQAGLPLPPGLGVLTRSELALWMWGKTLVTPAGVLAATFGLYVLNLVLPALPGAWLIARREG